MKNDPPEVISTRVRRFSGGVEVHTTHGRGGTHGAWDKRNEWWSSGIVKPNPLHSERDLLQPRTVGVWGAVKSTQREAFRSAAETAYRAWTDGRSLWA